MLEILKIVFQFLLTWLVVGIFLKFIHGVAITWLSFICWAVLAVVLYWIFML